MPAMPANLEISFIVVNWNTREYLLACLESIHRTVTDIPFEIILVDNASLDGSVEAVEKRFPEVHIIRNETNRGFAAANNQAFTPMRGRYALLLNTDAVLLDGAVKELHTFMETQTDAAMACGQLLNRDGTRQRSVAAFPSWLTLIANETLLSLLFPRKHPGKHRCPATPHPVDSCIGACLMVRSSAIREVGGFDERYFFFFEETDWALQMKKAGWSSYLVPQARIIHDQGQSVGQNVRARIHFYRSRYRYLRKWHPRSFVLLWTLVFLRLLVNTLLASAGVLLSFGTARALRRRLKVYIQLIFWHLKGCPEP
ncbi:Glycosyltransferase, group 2 family protein [uncultured Desulfatiglans sp.]|uniref:Glycosyltransferase, group 2 family protein n=1 Tax=Uncultured Desulfatiglans sp. TaxID=1748965 RepID=A0A653AHV9_UNCDX|nr:Glycosyltransferase, group 2 family protein [uncultured Desulfatiglans sp.]